MTPDIIGNVVVQYCIMWWNKLYKMYTTIYDSLSCQLCHCRWSPVTYYLYS
jgi:hypothetical protein